MVNDDAVDWKRQSIKNVNFSYVEDDENSNDDGL